MFALLRQLGRDEATQQMLWRTVSHCLSLQFAQSALELLVNLALSYTKGFPSGCPLDGSLD